MGDHSRALWDDESWEDEEEVVETVAMVGSGVARVRNKEGGEVHDGEGWENIEWKGEGDKGKEEEEEEDDDDDDDDEDEAAGDYFAQWEALLSDMSDDEVAELMDELAQHHESQQNGEGDHDDEDDDGGHHRDEL